MDSLTLSTGLRAKDKRLHASGGEEGGDTSRTDRKTGNGRWEMERKGREREQERAPVPSLNLSCSDQ